MSLSSETVNSVLPRRSARDGKRPGSHLESASIDSPLASAPKGRDHGSPYKTELMHAAKVSELPKFTTGMTFSAASALYLHISAYTLSPSEQLIAVLALTGTR